MTMALPWRGAAVLSLVFFASLGCGGSSLVDVKGKITLDSKSLSAQGLDQAVVQFVSDGGDIRHGSFDVDGNYSLQAPPGKYKVAVQAAKAAPKKEGLDFDYSLPVSIIDERYSDPTTSEIEIEVKHNAPAGHYDLKLKKLGPAPAIPPMPGA